MEGLAQSLQLVSAVGCILGHEASPGLEEDTEEDTGQALVLASVTSLPTPCNLCAWDDRK